MDPRPVKVELYQRRVLRGALEHVVIGRLILKDMDVLLWIPSRNVFVEKMGPDEACPFVAGGDPLDQVQGRQVEPAVVVRSRVFPHQERRAVDIRRTTEENVEFLVLVSGLADILPEDDELPGAFASPAVHDGHVDLCPSVLALVISSPVGPGDHFLHLDGANRDCCHQEGQYGSCRSG